jgi:hypothetical protein
MSRTAAKPATTPIPVQLSETEFTAFILPHLSMPKRGPKCTLGYHRLFNLILRVLYTGMQWKCLPIPKDGTGCAFSVAHGLLAWARRKAPASDKGGTRRKMPGFCT